MNKPNDPTLVVRVRAFAMFAVLDHYLSDYLDGNTSYEVDPFSVLDAIRNDCEDEDNIMRCELYQDYDPNYLANEMQSEYRSRLREYERLLGMYGITVSLLPDSPEIVEDDPRPSELDPEYKAWVDRQNNNVE